MRKEKSLREKLNQSFILIILLLFFVTVIISIVFFVRSYYYQNSKSIQQINDLAMNNIKYEYSNIEQYASNIARNDTVTTLMSQVKYNDVKYSLDACTKIKQYVLKNLSLMGSGNSIQILFPSEADYVDNFKLIEFRSENNFCEEFGINIDDLRDKNSFIKRFRGSYFFIYTRPILNVYNTDNIGTIAIYYDIRRNLKKFSNIGVSAKGMFILVDENGLILCHNREKYLFKNIKDEAFGQKLMGDDLSPVINDGGKKYFCYINIMPTTNWRAISVVPIDEFYRGIILLVLVVLIACIPVLFISLVLCKRFINQIMYPAKKICDSMEKTEKVSIDNDELFTEFEFMAQKYNDMVDCIKQQMDEISQNEREKRKADMRVLYEQINPHFLYNTLDSINWLMACNDDENSVRAGEMLSLLAGMLRIGLSKGRETISVSEEIEHVQNYLKIQEIRRDSAFEVYYDVSEECLDVQMIKIILQPVVENSIVHGFDEIESGGIIKIKVYSEEKDIIFVVSDNGSGCDTSVLEKNIKSGEGGFGLYNIQKRINLYYGEDYGLSVKRSDMGGTECIVRISRVIKNN